MTRLTTLFKHRFFKFCVLLLAVVALLWLGLRETSPDYRWDTATLKPFKQWYQINWHNQAVGRASVELKKKDQQFTVIESDYLEGRVQGRRFQFRYIRELDFSSRAPYELIGGRLYTEEPQLTVESTFSNDEQLQLKEKRNGQLYEKSFTHVEYTLQDYFRIPSLIERGSIPSESFENKTLNTQTFKVETSRYQVLKNKAYQSYIALQQQHTSNEVSWHRMAKDGVYKLHAFANGMEYVASSRRVTLNPEMQSDLYLNSGVVVDKPLGAANQIKSLTLSVQNGELDWFEHHPAVTINAARDTIQLSSGSRYKASSKDMEHFKAGRQSLNPIARTLALQAVADLDSDWQKVQQLVGYVYDYLNYQPVPAGFNIDDILQNKIGDCTEYSQLLIEMLSAANIAAREVNGLVYLGDHEKRFGGHVWVEVLIDDHWVAVDPTWNLLEVTSTHIPVAINLDIESLDTNQRFAFKLEEIHYKSKSKEDSKRL